MPFVYTSVTMFGCSYITPRESTYCKQEYRRTLAFDQHVDDTKTACARRPVNETLNSDYNYFLYLIKYLP